MEKGMLIYIHNIHVKTNCNAIELRKIQKAVQTFFCCESNFQG